MATRDVSVVLAHGAWADGSSWAKVITALKADGMKVFAAPLPLTSLADDVAALNRTFLNVCELTVTAALQHSREHVHHAALLDPAASSALSPSAIHDVVEELLAAHDLNYE